MSAWMNDWMNTWINIKVSEKLYANGFNFIQKIAGSLPDTSFDLHSLYSQQVLSFLDTGSISMLTGYMAWKTMVSECIEAQLSPITFSAAATVTDPYNIWTGLARVNKMVSNHINTGQPSKFQQPRGVQYSWPNYNVFVAFFIIERKEIMCNYLCFIHYLRIW